MKWAKRNLTPPKLMNIRYYKRMWTLFWNLMPTETDYAIRVDDTSSSDVIGMCVCIHRMLHFNLCVWVISVEEVKILKLQFITNRPFKSIFQLRIICLHKQNDENVFGLSAWLTKSLFIQSVNNLMRVDLWGTNICFNYDKHCAWTDHVHF